MAATPDQPKGADARHPLTLHASTVAVDGRAVLLTGPSGSGKSALAMALITRSGGRAGLVADDRTAVHRDGADLIASCPAPISGILEARGLGLLQVPPHPPAPIRLVVNLGEIETERFPPQRHLRLLEIDLPLLHKVEAGHFADALLLYIMNGRYRP